jgi:hypothetical protein
MNRSLVTVFGILGLVGCFLPLAMGVSWWDLRSLDSVFWLVMVGYAVPMFVGLNGKDTTFGGALAATLGFGYIVFKFGFDIFDLFFNASIGGIMMGVGAVGGLVVSVTSLLVFARKR